MAEVVRLFPVEGRTRLERENTRRMSRRAQGELFEAIAELVAELLPACPVCGGCHEGACAKGTALTLDVVAAWSEVNR